MGSYERSFVVDGVEYELYKQLDQPVYQLVDRSGRPLAEFADVPSHQTVVAAVCASASSEPG